MTYKCLDDVTVVAEGNPSTEKRSAVLEALGFVRHDSARAQWFYLIDEMRRGLRYDEDDHLWSYLVLMLERFQDRPDWCDLLLGFTFFRASLTPSAVDERLLRDVADIALQCAALFPERATYRHAMMNDNTYDDFGRAAFSVLSEREGDNWWGVAFHKMSRHFHEAKNVLSVIRPKERCYGSHGAGCRGAYVMPRQGTTASMVRAAQIFEKLYLQSDDRMM